MYIWKNSPSLKQSKIHVLEGGLLIVVEHSLEA